VHCVEAVVRLIIVASSWSNKSFHNKDVWSHEHQIRNMFGFLTLEFGTDMLSRNVGKELLLLAQ